MMAQQQQMKVTASSNVQLLQQQQYHHSQQRGPGPMGHPYHFQSQQHLAASARLPLPHGGRNGHDYGGYIGGGGYDTGLVAALTYDPTSSVNLYDHPSLRLGGGGPYSRRKRNSSFDDVWRGSGNGGGGPELAEEITELDGALALVPIVPITDPSRRQQRASS